MPCRRPGMGESGGRTSGDAPSVGDMQLLLLSLGSGAVPGFIAKHVPPDADPVRLGYLADAALQYAGQPFAVAERERLIRLGFELVDLTAGEHRRAQDFDRALDGIDALYVAGGSSFALLAALRRNGSDHVLIDRVRGGLPYIGSSAGSVVTGLSIEPLSLMDDPGDAPDLVDYAGLGLVDTVVIPHADGALPPFPPSLINDIVARYGARFPLTLVRDDEAILVEDGVRRSIASP